MSTIIRIFTGSAGPGIAIAAAATALRMAEIEHKTLLFSLGPSHDISTLLGTTVGTEVQQVAPFLDTLSFDALTNVAKAWNNGRANMRSPMAQISGDELPMLPGTDMIMGLLHLRELISSYAFIAIDAGSQDELLRTLSFPDQIRWIVRLLFGLDRGPGRNPATVANALLPTSFIPVEVRDRVQKFRIEAEGARDLLTDTLDAAIRYVLRPDKAGLEQARLAIPALQLHGLPVSVLIAGPLLPHDIADERMLRLAEQQNTIVEEARQIWTSRPLLPFVLRDPPEEQAVLRRIGTQIEQGVRDTGASPLTAHDHDASAVVIDLPGLPKGALQLAVHGDELIVRIGPYRRHMILPENLRRTGNIRATRDGDRLIVRRREAS